MVGRGPYVSCANCGLSYHVSGVISKESSLLLVLSPGAPSVRPPLPGIDLPGIFQVRTVPKVRAIREWIERGTEFLTGMFTYSGIIFGQKGLMAGLGLQGNQIAAITPK